MRARVFLQLMLCTVLNGCAHPTDPFRHAFKEPVAGVDDFFPSPAIVRVNTAAPDQVTYEYARMKGSDLPYAIEAAERACIPAGKRAHMVSMGVRTFVRGWVTFKCL